MSALPATSANPAVPLETALKIAAARWKPNGLFGRSLCPVFWRDVFMQVYGEEPDDTATEDERRKGKRDPRWDELFHNGGFKKYDELFGKE